MQILNSKKLSHNFKIFTPEQAEKEIHFLPYNRDSNVRKDLLESMQNFGFISPIIIIKTDVIDGKKKFFCVEGQHRTKTALFLGLNIPAFILQLEVDSEKDIVHLMAKLNATQKKWETRNYVNAWTVFGKDNYKLLNKLKTTYPWSYKTLGSLFYSNSASSTEALNAIKDGNFEFRYKDSGLRTLDFAVKLSKFKKPSTRMMKALHRVLNVKDFNETRFVNNYKSKIHQHIDLDHFTSLFKSWS